LECNQRLIFVETVPARVGGRVPAQNRTDTLKSHRCEVEIVHNRASIHFWYIGAMRKSIQPHAAGFRTRNRSVRLSVVECMPRPCAGVEEGENSKREHILRWRVQCGITQNAHSVALVTGYHRLLSTKGDLQHLLPGAAHALPQH